MLSNRKNLPSTEETADWRIFPTAAAWLKALAGPALQTEIHLAGYASRAILPKPVRGPRRLEEHVIYLVSQGSMDLDVEGEKHTLHDGGLFWMQPGVTHTIRVAPTAPTFGRYYLRGWFRCKGRVARLAEPVVVLHHAGCLEPTFRKYIEVFQATDPALVSWKAPRLRAALLLLLSEVLAAWQKPDNSPRQFNPAQRQQIFEYVAQHPDCRFSSRELAALFGLSPEYFARLFRGTFNAAPKVWLKEQRVRAAAAELIESTAPLKEIMRKFGYNDHYMFSRQFKQVTGLSPRAFRKRHITPLDRK